MAPVARYAGFKQPEEILSDPVLSVDQKRETLKHWLARARRQREDTAADGALLKALERARRDIDRDRY